MPIHTNINYRNLGSDFIHGTYTGSVSSGEVVNVGHKPKYIFLFNSESTGTNTYYNLYIHFIPGYSDSICFAYRTNNTIGSSNTTISYQHQEQNISTYITMTDTGFISKKNYGNCTIVY